MKPVSLGEEVVIKSPPKQKRPAENGPPEDSYARSESSAGVSSVQIPAVTNGDGMKRDMDLIRDLLLYIEEDPIFDGARWMTPGTPSEIGVPGRSLEEVAYHLTLMIEASLVRGQWGSPMPMVSRLTWEGHEFLDNIRDKGIWSATKKKIGGLQSVAMSVLVEVAKAEVKKHLGLP
jgi:hypothetical protein